MSKEFERIESNGIIVYRVYGDANKQIAVLTPDAAYNLLDDMHQMSEQIYLDAHREQEEPSMVKCQYCGNMHYTGTVEQCPLKPGQ